MEEGTCHEMVIYLSQRFSRLSMLCFVVVFMHLFISSKYDYRVDTENMIVKMPEI